MWKLWFSVLIFDFTHIIKKIKSSYLNIMFINIFFFFIETSY